MMMMKSVMHGQCDARPNCDCDSGSFSNNFPIHKPTLTLFGSLN